MEAGSIQRIKEIDAMYIPYGKYFGSTIGDIYEKDLEHLKELCKRGDKFADTVAEYLELMGDM